MNIRMAHFILKSLRKASIKDPRLRVAARWIQASLDKEYDQFLRAQILEGAAGVRTDTWWKNGARGLRKAKQYFEDKGASVDPKWFDPGNTGMVGILKSAIARASRSSGLDVDPDEVLNNALMGLSFDSSRFNLKRPPYEAGKRLSEKIMSGQETPRSVAAGKLKAYLVRKVLTEAKTLKRFHQQLPQGLEGQEIDIADTREEERNAGDFLLSLIFWQPNDPLGKKIRDFMRKTWADMGGSPQVSMNTWLDIVEQEGRIPDKKEVARKTPHPKDPTKSISVQTFVQRHWPRAWRHVFDSLWNNKQLLSQLQKRYEEERIPWFQEKPNPDDIFVRKTWQKSSKVKEAYRLMANRVAKRWYEDSVDSRVQSNNIA